MSVDILVRGRDRNIAGVLTDWVSLTCTRVLNSAGTWSLTTPATPDAAAVLKPGYGIVIVRDGVVFASGPLEDPAFDRKDRDQLGTLTVSGTTDLALLADRVVYPDPTAATTAQTASAQYVRSGVAGDVMLDLVAVNAGPAALAERRVAGLVTGAGAGVGGQVRTNARFAVLTDELRTLAQVGGGLVFDVAQGLGPNGFDQSLVFSVAAPRDLSGSARFGFELGNLRSVAYSEVAPTATRAVVAGQGVGTARTVLEYGDATSEDAWARRVEAFIDQRDTNDPVQLAQSGTKALADGSRKAQLSSVTVDSPGLMFGRDFGLGDAVSVSPRSDVAVTALVREVTLEASRDGGELVTCLIGSPDASSTPGDLRLVRDLELRLSHLERNA